ncbi:MAG TPA: 50S ribosomal protein L28 [Gammaproteobacteria bacterium]|jgi:large subunit ribosomal protein L28|nr:50S ribosomal protein L28 [Gammaproteobacteria bacterium]
MSRVCQVTGKAVMAGNNVSHSNRKTRRRFLPNLQSHRFWIPGQVPGKGRFIKLVVSHKGMRTIDKLGIEAVLAALSAREKEAASDN